MQSQVEKLWRHTVAANVSYYRAVGRLTSDYVRALAAVAREVVPRPGGSESFVAPDGRQVQPTIGFEPPQLLLAPGEQLVVRAGLTLAEEMEPGADYRGEFVVPGLPGTSIPVVLRRRAAAGGRSTRARKTQTAS